MRPRLLHLGYDVGHGAGKYGSLASMRPRLLHLGYVLWNSIFIFIENQLQ